MAKRRVDDYEDSEEYFALKRAIGKRMRALRMDRGLSGRKVAELAEISTANYGVIESGYANVTLMSLDRIARALAVPLVSLLEDTPAQTTTGVEGALVAVRADLDQAHKQLDLCREELVRVSSRLQGFVDATQEALKQVANAEKKATRRTDKK
jgi:transcriptional regulator with XRE-family HTH domain